MSLLVRTPQAHPRESLLGYVLRVSEINGYATPWNVLCVAGIEPGQAHTAGFPVHKLAAALGRSPQALESMAYVRAGTTQGFQLLGQDLGRSARSLPLQLRAPKICAQCVAEHGYIDAYWDLTVAFACPLHRREALRQCPACGKKLRWARPGLLTCRCGASLSDVQTPNVPAEFAALLEVLMAKLHGRALVTLGNAEGLPLQSLEAMTLKDLYAMLQCMASAWERLCLGVRGEGSKASEHAWRVVAKALAHWPRGYRDFLQEMGEQVFHDRKVSGLVRQFQPFYDPVLKRRTRAEDGAFLREEFFRFGALEWGQALPDVKTARAAGQNDAARFVSKSAYAREHGITKPTLERLLAGGSIASKQVGKGPAARHVVDLAQSTAPKQAVGLLTEREAAAALGIPVSVLRILREWGVYQAAPRLGYAQAWYQDDVEACIRLALNRVPTVPPNAADGEVLRDIMRRKFGDAKVKARIVEAVLQGALPIRRALTPTLGGLEVDAASLRQLLRQTRVQTDQDDLSVHAAANCTGLDPAAVAHAVEAGLLQAVGEGAHHRISMASVRQFSSKFATLASIADECGTTSVSLRGTCEDIGVAIIEVNCATDRRPDRKQPIVTRQDGDRLRDQRLQRAQAKEQRRIEGAGRIPSYERALRSYLDDLIANAEALPTRGGKPNRAVIARKAGFGRDVFYDHPSVQAVLEAYLDES